MKARIAVLGCTGVLLLSACGSDDDVLPAELSPTDACNAVASDPEVAGDGTAELLRAARTTEGGLAQWLAGRHGPDGPSQTSSPAPDPAAAVEVCVFRGTVPRPISMPPGAALDTTGVTVFVRSGAVTLDAVGAPERLAKELDSLP